MVGSVVVCLLLAAALACSGLLILGVVIVCCGELKEKTPLWALRERRIKPTVMARAIWYDTHSGPYWYEEWGLSYQQIARGAAWLARLEFWWGCLVQLGGLMNDILGRAIRKPQNAALL